MALLSGFQQDLSDVKLMGLASIAAFNGKPIPAGWNVVTPADLGLAAKYQNGNYFKNGNSGASAIVLEKDGDYIVSFRGTDGNADIVNYPKLADGSYINFFKPLLTAMAALAAADPAADFSFTGASLGGGATNNLAKIAGSAYGGEFADATFVAFASPNITNASGILNVGFENDPVFKGIGGYKNYSSSLDNLVLATNKYLAGNYDGRHPFNTDAHDNKVGFEALDRLAASEFYSDMSRDSVVIFSASTGTIQDKDPGRSTMGAFYLGQSTADKIVGRGGNDSIEGFSGNDNLSGGAGRDRLKGGEGNDTLNGGSSVDKLDGGNGDDTLTVKAAEGLSDELLGGAGTDSLKISGTDAVTLSGFNASASSIEIWLGNGKSVVGTSAANTFDFSGLTAKSGLSYVDAGSGNDVLIASDFGDVLRGGAGADTITSGLGNDNFGGGTGVDTFVFGPDFGKDKITDFVEGDGINDVIQFDSSVFADFNAVLAVAVEVGVNVEIRLDADNVLTLNNVSLTAATHLVADDFQFV